MITLPVELKTSFNNIDKCDLVVKRVDSIDSILEFQYLLNSAMPRRESNNFKIREFFKGLFFKNEELIYELITKNAELLPLILWMRTEYILRFFNISDLVFINFNKYKNTYYVKQKSSQKESDQEQTPANEEETSKLVKALKDIIVENN